MQGDVAGRVRRRRIEKRPLNLAALGALGPAEGGVPESKDTLVPGQGCRHLSEPRDGPGVVEPSSSRQCDGTRQGRH